MGKTRAECSQNAYTSAFLSHWIQILANSSPKSDIKKINIKKTRPCFFAFYGRSGEGNIKKKKNWPYESHLFVFIIAVFLLRVNRVFFRSQTSLNFRRLGLLLYTILISQLSVSPVCRDVRVQILIWFHHFCSSQNPIFQTFSQKLSHPCVWKLELSWFHSVHPLYDKLKTHKMVDAWGFQIWNLI